LIPSFVSENILGKKDYLSMLAIKKYGGIYLDHDVICHESLDILRDKY
jgi:mannosyltransferase OCH1-like enzyme